MKNPALKGALGALAILGIAKMAKKAGKRREFMKGIMDEYGIKERSPFAFADKIRELDDEKYNELKDKMKKQFSHGCCGRHQQKQEKAEA